MELRGQGIHCAPLLTHTSQQHSRINSVPLPATFRHSQKQLVKYRAASKQGCWRSICQSKAALLSSISCREQGCLPIMMMLQIGTASPEVVSHEAHLLHDLLSPACQAGQAAVGHAAAPVKLSEKWSHQHDLCHAWGTHGCLVACRQH